MQAGSRATDDEGAVSADWVIPLLVAGALTAGIALVATDGGLEGNLTSPEANVSHADEEPLPGAAQGGAEAGTEASGTDANASDEADAADDIDQDETTEPEDPQDDNGTDEPGTSAGLGERWQNLEPAVDLQSWSVEDVVPGPSGERVYAAGRGVTSEGQPNGTPVGFVAALDAREGAVEWVFTTSGPENREARFHGLAIDASGQLLAAAGGTRVDDQSALYAAAVNATTGEPRWTSTVRDPEVGHGRAEDVALTPDGRHLLATGTNTRVAVAFDGITGEHGWTVHADEMEDTIGFTGEALAAGPANERVYVTGRHHPSSSEANVSMGTLALDVEDGQRLWIATEPVDAGVGRGQDVAVDPTGHRVAVAGVVRDRATDSDRVTAVYEASSGEPLWTHRYDGHQGGSDEAKAVAFGPAGAGVYVTGTASTPDNETDAATTAFEATDGSVIWRATYDGGAGAVDRATDIVADPLGRAVFLTAASRGEPGGWDDDTATLAYEARTGELLAEQRFDATSDNTSRERRHRLAVTAGGTHLVLAGSSWGSGGTGPFALGYDVHLGEPSDDDPPPEPSPNTPQQPALVERWNTTEPAPGLQDMRLVQAAASRDPALLLATGSARTTEATEHHDQGDVVAFVTARDADSGEHRWTTTIGPAGETSLFRSLDVADDAGLVAAAGQTRGENESRLLAAALNLTTGEPAWTTTLVPDDAQQASARDVILAPEAGRVAAVGTSGQDRLTVGFEAATGEPAWIALDEAGSSQRSVGRAIATGPSEDRVYVVGRDARTDARVGALVTTAYRLEDGGEAWSASWRQTDESHARAQAIRVGPAGERVAVAGTSVNEDTFGDLATVVYDTSEGRQLWARHHDGPTSGGDQARGLAFAPDGHTVFLAGEVSAHDGTTDAITIAYDPAEGSERWSQTYTGDATGPDLGLALATDESATYLMARSSGGPDGDQDATLLALDATSGQLRDETRFDLDPDTSTSEHPMDLALAPQGDWIGLVGAIGEPRDGSPLAVAYDIQR